MQQENECSISVTWRGEKFMVKMNSVASLKELGQSLQKLTNVKADTMRLIVPSIKSSKLLAPFSEEHSSLTLPETSIIEGKSIKMMGVPEAEVNEILESAKANLRIAGFDEEDKRLRQRSERSHNSLKLPQGPYIFCEFRTLHIPGLELNPPPSEALKRMHMLAADPGIVAIMNKHRWRVGIMTEMPPVGYVGVSPKCLLGFNKNHGEEISLRLRTDDLKGFRKYESIKKTLLHELAHMVHTEHDANFYALDKQLNEEAAKLNWTRSKSHTLSGVQQSERYEEDFHTNNVNNMSQKLGGDRVDRLANARATSVAAAYGRLENAHLNLAASKVHEEPDPDFSESNTWRLPNEMDALLKDNTRTEDGNKTHIQFGSDDEPDPDENKFEPDPDDIEGAETMELEQYMEPVGKRILLDSEPEDVRMKQSLHPSMTELKLVGTKSCAELDPNALGVSLENGIVIERDHNCSGSSMQYEIQAVKRHDEPDPDDSEAKQNNIPCPPDQDNVVAVDYKEPNHDTFHSNGLVETETDPDDTSRLDIQTMQIDEPNLDDQELKRIQDPVAVICGRLQNAIKMLQTEVNPSVAATVLQTLFKIIRNVIENPHDMKFKKLRKANPAFQRNVANYRAAMEILFLIGFNEDVVQDEIGKAETYLVLKRNDPGLLWLAKSSLETCIAY